MTRTPEDIPDRSGESLPSPLRIAPDRYVLAEDALANVDRYIGSMDVSSVYVLGGEQGYNAVRDELEASLERAGIDARYAAFDGECSPSAVFDHRDRIERLEPDALIGVGGGKALDTAKLAAEGRCPVVAVPTSAATCAAWTALSIVYESDGTYRGGVSLSRCPELVVGDLGLLADAPARLLANGVMDASAKHFETRLISEAKRPSNRWGIRLAEEAYLDELREYAGRAYEDVQADAVTPAVENVVEAVIAGPGLAAGLLSDRSYLGLAHVFCYSLLEYGSVRSHSYHGERVAYGVVLLRMLSNDDTSPDPSELLDWYKRLGADPTLQGLGVDPNEEIIDDIAQDVVDGLEHAVLTVPASRSDVAEAIHRIERMAATDE